MGFGSRKGDTEVTRPGRRHREKETRSVRGKVGNLRKEIEIAGFRRNAGLVRRDRIARIRDGACSSAKINRIFRDKCLPTCFQMVSSARPELPAGPRSSPRPPTRSRNLPTKGQGDPPSTRHRLSEHYSPDIPRIK